MSKDKNQTKQKSKTLLNSFTKTRYENIGGIMVTFENFQLIRRLEEMNNP